MPAFRCVPIPTPTAERFRRTQTDDRGNRLRRIEAAVGSLIPADTACTAPCPANSCCSGRTTFRGQPASIGRRARSSSMRQNARGSPPTARWPRSSPPTPWFPCGPTTTTISASTTSVGSAQELRSMNLSRGRLMIPERGSSTSTRHARAACSSASSAPGHKRSLFNGVEVPGAIDQPKVNHRTSSQTPSLHTVLASGATRAAARTSVILLPFRCFAPLAITNRPDPYRRSSTRIGVLRTRMPVAL